MTTEKPAEKTDDEKAAEKMSDDRIDGMLTDDYPRIVRKDMTCMTEMLAKYRHFRSQAEENGRDDVSDQLKDVEVVIMNLRDALDDLLTAEGRAYA